MLTLKGARSLHLHISRKQWTHKVTHTHTVRASHVTRSAPQEMVFPEKNRMCCSDEASSFPVPLVTVMLPNVSHLTSVLLPKSCCGKTWDKNNLKFWAFSFHSLPHFLCFQPQSSPNLSAFRCFSDQLRVQAPWGFSPPLVSFFLLFFLCF